MNVDQSTRAIPIIDSVLVETQYGFFDQMYEMATLICLLYLTMILAGKMNLVFGRIGR